MALRAGALVLPCSLGGTALGVLVVDPSAGPRTVPLVALVASCAAATIVLGALLGGQRWTLAVTAGGSLAVGVLLGSMRSAAVAPPTGPDAVTALIGGEWRITGTVTDDPRPHADRLQVVVESVAAESTRRSAGGTDQGPTRLRGHLLAWLPRAADARAGDRVTLQATVEQPQDFDGFAYRAYLARQGIGAVARSFDARVTSRGDAGPTAVLAPARGWLLDGLDAIVPEPEAALGAGILLGVRSSIAPEISDAFAVAGLTHVVAISGWNIAIVATLVGNLLGGARGRSGGRIIAPVMTSAAIGGYVLLVGASPSVVRAALMAGALVAGRIAGSRAHAASALMLASEAMLLAAPPVLWDVGFQLSALATAGLIGFAAPIEARLARLPGWIREPLALTLAAQLATLPVILTSFERLSLVAPLANVAIVPLVPVVMLGCALAAPVGAVDATMHVPILGDAATWFAGGSAWLGLRVMIAAGSAASSIPGAAVNVAPPAWLPAVWYPGLVLIWRRWGRTDGAPPPAEPIPLDVAGAPAFGRSHEASWLRVAGVGLLRVASRPIGLLAIDALLLAGTTLASMPDGRLHLSVLDIGQGDAILIVAPSGPAMLIDGGPDPELTLRRLGGALPWWRRDLAVVLLTHPHQDHVGGLVDVLRRFRVGLTMDSGRPYPNADYARFLALAKSEPKSRLVLARAGQLVHLDPGTTLEVLYPADADRRAPLPRNDINNASVVMVLRFRGFAALLTGDAQAPIEATLRQRELIGPVDVLKVGHHGSNFATSDLLLDAIRPAAAIISVGAANPYGHPGSETLRRLAARPMVDVLRTDRDGTAQVATDGRSWTLTTRAGTTAPIATYASRSPSGASLSLRANGVTATPESGAGSIGAWPSRRPSAPGRSSPSSRSRRESSRIPRGLRASRSRPAGSSRPRGSRSTFSSSRSPPCSTTSTSRRFDGAAASMGSSARSCSWSWATPSWPCLSPRIR
jgi:competence protein ComEC